jgi:hypothetical protein
MLRRITSWQAKGFIYEIRNIQLDKMYFYGRTWEHFPSTAGPGDRSLVLFLDNMRQDDELKRSVILDHYPDSNASHFSSIFNNLGSAGSPPAPVFSRETFLEFHKLTIAAFNGYESSFTKLGAAYAKLVSIGY